jgi:hypothetical protein
MHVLDFAILSTLGDRLVGEVKMRAAACKDSGFLTLMVINGNGYTTKEYYFAAECALLVYE